MRGLRRFRRNEKGATAIEFAFLIAPFAVLLFGTIESALLYVSDIELQASLNKTTRDIRTGEISSSSTTLADFKSQICAKIHLAPGCADNLMVRIAVVSDISAPDLRNAIDEDGLMTVSESFDTGTAGDFVLAQAFLPYSTVLDLYSLSPTRLADGRYIVAAADIFRNEPF